MTDPTPPDEALPPFTQDGELYLLCCLPADTRAAELSRASAVDLAQLLAALQEEQRAKVLAPYFGEGASIGGKILELAERVAARDLPRVADIESQLTTALRERDEARQELDEWRAAHDCSPAEGEVST